MAQKLLTRDEIQKTINQTRDFLASRRYVPIATHQRATTADPGVRGPAWVTKTTLPKPERSNITEIVEAVVAELAKGNEKHIPCGVAEVKAEWVGYRHGPALNGPESKDVAALPAKDKYQNMMAEVRSPTVMLYCHGGNF